MVAGGLLAVALGVVFIPQALATRPNAIPGATPQLVMPLPSAPKYTVSCAMPQGAPGCCVMVDAGAGTSTYCDAATKCYTRFVAAPTDGGPFPDAGATFAVLGADSPIAADSARVWGLVDAQNAVCGVSADGGTLNVSVLAP